MQCKAAKCNAAYFCRRREIVLTAQQLGSQTVACPSSISVSAWWGTGSRRARSCGPSFVIEPVEVEIERTEELISRQQALNNLKLHRLGVIGTLGVPVHCARCHHWKADHQFLIELYCRVTRLKSKQYFFDRVISLFTSFLQNDF